MDRRSRRTPVLTALSLATIGMAQDPTSGQQVDWRYPFRNPQRNVAVPEDLFRELRAMEQHTPDLESAKISYDEDGRLRCNDPSWQAAYERFRLIPFDAGWVSQVLRESGSIADRKTAMYGAFQGDVVEYVFNLVEHIPGEPIPEIRQLGYQLAVEYLRAHIGEKVEGDVRDWMAMKVGPAVDKGPKPGTYRYNFDIAPFLALLDYPGANSRDRAQLFWFLREVATMREDLRRIFPALAGDGMKRAMRSDDPTERQAAYALLDAVDPAADREHPDLEDPAEEFDRWLEAVLYDLWPPLRPISDGLMELYPSEDLNQLAADGRRYLSAGSIGDPTNGSLKSGSPYRGLQLSRIPEELEILGMQVGDVVVSINGNPVATCGEVLDYIEATMGWKVPPGRYMVEFVRSGESKLREFRLGR